MAKTSKSAPARQLQRRWASALRRLADLVEQNEAHFSDVEDDDDESHFYWMGIHRDILKAIKWPVTRSRPA